MSSPERVGDFVAGLAAAGVVAGMVYVAWTLLADWNGAVMAKCEMRLVKPQPPVEFVLELAPRIERLRDVLAPMTER